MIGDAIYMTMSFSPLNTSSLMLALVALCNSSKNAYPVLNQCFSISHNSPMLSVSENMIPYLTSAYIIYSPIYLVLQPLLSSCLSKIGFGDGPSDAVLAGLFA